ncbi:MAG: hypothetical protein VX254_05915 [Planctomycetota bacterium]|nr:hypothetical protein [Planctomycetota bacterium]MEE3199552.1 hypothetical protein [Planctomycetota bacterium]
MDNVLGTLKGLIRDVTEVGIYLLALGVVAGILFGTGEAAQLAFVGDVVANVVKLVGDLGGAGLTGLLSLAVILYLFKR